MTERAGESLRERIAEMIYAHAPVKHERWAGLYTAKEVIPFAELITRKRRPFLETADRVLAALADTPEPSECRTCGGTGIIEVSDCGVTWDMHCPDCSEVLPSGEPSAPVPDALRERIEALYVAAWGAHEVLAARLPVSDALPALTAALAPFAWVDGRLATPSAPTGEPSDAPRRPIAKLPLTHERLHLIAAEIAESLDFGQLPDADAITEILHKRLARWLSRPHEASEPSVHSPLRGEQWPQGVADLDAMTGEPSDAPCRTREFVPTIHEHADGGYVWTECPQCGPDVKVDEDGECLMCGDDVLRYGKRPHEASEPSGDGLREALDALEQIADVGEKDAHGGVYTTGEGHARCIEIARAALSKRTTEQ